MWFHFVSKWNWKLFKICSLRTMRCVMTRGLCWDATYIGVTASLIQAQAGLEPGLCISHRWLLVILGRCWVLSDMASIGHFSFNTHDEPAAFRFCGSDEVFLSLAFIKTSSLTWTSCRFLEINTFLQNPSVLPNRSFLHQLLILFHEYLTAWINQL